MFKEKYMIGEATIKSSTNIAYTRRMINLPKKMYLFRDTLMKIGATRKKNTMLAINEGIGPRRISTTYLPR
jgi:hypothetical protein